MKPAPGQTVRVRGFAYRHKIVRLCGDGERHAVVEQRGGRNHGARRTVDRHRVRG